LHAIPRVLDYQRGISYGKRIMDKQSIEESADDLVVETSACEMVCVKMQDDKECLYDTLHLSFFAFPGFQLTVISYSNDAPT